MVLKHLKLLEYDDIDKIIIFTGYSDISGIALADKLRNEYNIEVEMASASYVVLITTEFDDFKNYKILSSALKKIDDIVSEDEYIAPIPMSLPEIYCNLFEVTDIKAVNINLSAGKVCGEYIWAYPPGIPLIVPGEIISEQLIEEFKKNIGIGVNIQSSNMEFPEKIYCQS